MGPGWYCDGCGDYRMHDGKESYSVAKRELRTENERLLAVVKAAKKWRNSEDEKHAIALVRALDALEGP
jgi:hypothetical protein